MHAFLLLALIACRNDWQSNDIPTDDSAVEDVDRDNDGVTIAEGDCDDDDPDVHPGATEVCNDTDDDCNGAVDDAVGELWYADADQDGYGDPYATSWSCDESTGYVADASDCDDARDDVFPGAEEVCDEVDQDCDLEIDEGAQTTFFLDADGDGYGDPAATTSACELPGDHAVVAGDCNDSDATVHPEADETCNDLDDDCDDSVDEDAIDAEPFYRDRDEDGWGDSEDWSTACAEPSGYVAQVGDCDDTNSAMNPDATELCNGFDDDCDGDTDGDDATDPDTWYADADSDGYGDAASPTIACDAPSGTVSNASDCDDSDPLAHPGAVEICDDADNDCNGEIDESSAVDATTWYADTDGDGHGDADPATVACDQPTAFVADDSDCDDGDASVSPVATEVCNGQDDDCDGTSDEDDAVDATIWTLDADGDGYGDEGTSLVQTACEAPSGYADNARDCDDSDGAVNPGAIEVCNGLDDDCDGDSDTDATDMITSYVDFDGDGYGNPDYEQEACEVPTGWVEDDTDCDDGNAAAFPGSVETCDGDDDDCDGDVDEDASDATTFYLDADGDGYGGYGGTTAACSLPSGYGVDDSDCDDSDAAVSPVGTEDCNGVDDDCDGEADNGVLGSDATCAAETCQAIVDAGADSGDGTYWLDPVGDGADEWTCDMTTDGGGWTRIVTWNREDDGDSQGDFESRFTEITNEMGDWSEASTYIQWSDLDVNADVMAYYVDVEVPNDGEVIYDVHYTGTSMDGSGIWYFLEDVDGTTEDLLCKDDSLNNYPSYYTDADIAWRPYECGHSADTSWEWDTTTQDGISTEIAAFHLWSLHSDQDYGDYSRLYRIEVLVR